MLRRGRMVGWRHFTHRPLRTTWYVSRFKQCGIRNRPYASNEHGLSLVSTLWIITILSLLATQFLHSIYLERRVQANFADRTKFHYAAKAGFEHSIAMLRSDETPFDALDEDWATTIEHQIEDGITVGNLLTYQVDITDESSKVNINTADGDVIGDLLGLIGYEDLESAEGSLIDEIEQSRPFHTVRDLAKVEGMTQTLLYGSQQQTVEGSDIDGNGTQTLPGLIDLTTVYSIDTNTDGNGQKRINIKSAGEDQLTEIRGNDNQPIFSQDEAESLTQQRDSIESIGNLLDLQAVSEQTFEVIRNRISTETEEESEELVNINTADASHLQALDGIDQGIAHRIINHRDNQGDFLNIDAIKEVKMVTTNEFKSIVDKISTTNDETLNGLISVNTASVEILQLLPGMDESKAQAIIDRRESEDGQKSQPQSQDENEGNPFTDIGQVLDVEGIDIDTFQQIAGLITYRSHGFLIEASGIDSRGKTIASCIGAVDRTGQQVALKYWRQN